MDLQKQIKRIQTFSVVIILIGAFLGFLNEVFLMILNEKIELADLLLLFIYVEVMGMVRVYLSS